MKTLIPSIVLAAVAFGMGMVYRPNESTPAPQSVDTDARDESSAEAGAGGDSSSVSESTSAEGIFPARPTRVLFFTADWCAPCQQVKAGLDRMADAGWRVDGTNQAHIQVVDPSTPHGKHLAQLYGVRSLPSFVRVSDAEGNGDVITGVLSPQEIGRLYSGEAPRRGESAPEVGRGFQTRRGFFRGG